MSEENTMNKTVVFSSKAEKTSGHIVTILDGKEQLRQIDLNKLGLKEITFGRGKDTVTPDICLASPIVSRLHGRFVFENGQWYVEDLGSTNGILRNESYIHRRPLYEGDILRIGSRKKERTDAVLLLISSDKSGTSWKRFPLDKNPITIGRSESNDVVLPHVSVSRRHASLKWNGNEWIIKNENSENGLIVNGHSVRDSVVLREQDVISITNTKIIFSSKALFVCSYNNGISVDARGIVVVRGKGSHSFVTSDHVDMTISPGELVAIIGGSGAGKSTIMNVLCGYLRPSEGSVYINGSDLYQNFDALKKCFGYVPQSDIVYNNLSLYDMLRYTAELRLPKDMSEEEREKAIDKAIAMVDLEEKKNSLIRELSGGQRKRASIAVELLPDPKLLFLDEPASGLDPGTERSLMNSLRKMTNAGKTVILVTHSTLQLSLCDKIAFMGKGGKLCFYGNEQEALAFFGTRDIVDVYAKITDHSAEWHDKYVKSYQLPEENKTSEGVGENQNKDRMHQLGVLCKRYTKLVLNDRQRLLLLILQAPLLAVLISLVADGKQFEQYTMTKSLLFTLSCSAFWIGMLNAIQEICKERTILKREYMTGLSLSAYTLSKIIVLGILCLLQCVLLISVFWLLVGIPKEGLILPSMLEMLLTAWLTALSATAMGLFVSSLFTNPDRAMTVAPLLLMPQMLYSAILFKLSGATEYVSWLTICRWSMEGFGTTANLNNLYDVMPEQGIPMEHEVESFFEYTAGHLWSTWLILLGFTVLFLVLARVVLARIRDASN